jgi:hypothetical protein
VFSEFWIYSISNVIASEAKQSPLSLMEVMLRLITCILQNAGGNDMHLPQFSQTLEFFLAQLDICCREVFANVLWVS